MNFLKTFFLISTGTSALTDHGRRFGVWDVCSLKVCKACSQNALPSYKKFCSNLLRIPNCCNRYFGHTGALVPSVDHHQMTPLLPKPTKSLHIRVFDIFIWITFVFLLIFSLKSCIPKSCIPKLPNNMQP